MPFRVKTEADFILEDKYDIANKEVAIEAGMWTRREKYRRRLKIYKQHLKEMQTTGPKKVLPKNTDG